MITSYKFFEETTVPKDELIVSRTDLNGYITYANDIFADISGYSIDELIGKPHSIVRHPDMPKSVFKKMWETLKKEDIWKGYVKNIRKDSGYYWVYAEVSGVYKDGNLVEYKSMRSPVSSDDKANYQEQYDELRKKEEKSCRIVINISAENLEKLKKLALQENISENKIINYILTDSLF